MPGLWHSRDTLSARMWDMLPLYATGETISAREIADATGASRQTVTGILRTWRQVGAVGSGPSPHGVRLVVWWRRQRDRPSSRPLM